MFNAKKANELSLQAKKNINIEGELKYVLESIKSNAECGMNTANIGIKAAAREAVLDRLQRLGFKTLLTTGDLIRVDW